MTKQEKINQLKKVNVIVCGITYWSSEYTFEYSIITPDGAGTSMYDFSEWPCKKYPLDDEIRKVCNRIQHGEEVSDDELLETRFCHLVLDFSYDNVKKNDLNKCVQAIREGFKNIDISLDYVYAHVILLEDVIEVRFFSKLEEMNLYFKERWGEGLKSYEDMDQEEIDEWYEYAKEEDFVDMVPYQDLCHNECEDEK